MVLLLLYIDVAVMVAVGSSCSFSIDNAAGAPDAVIFDSSLCVEVVGLLCVSCRPCC